MVEMSRRTTRIANSSDAVEEERARAHIQEPGSLRISTSLDCQLGLR